jgi:hypothetical protein
MWYLTSLINRYNTVLLSVDYNNVRMLGVKATFTDDDNNVKIIDFYKVGRDFVEFSDFTYFMHKEIGECIGFNSEDGFLMTISKMDLKLYSCLEYSGVVNIDKYRHIDFGGMPLTAPLNTRAYLIVNVKDKGRYATLGDLLLNYQDHYIIDNNTLILVGSFNTLFIYNILCGADKFKLLVTKLKILG